MRFKFFRKRRYSEPLENVFYETDFSTHGSKEFFDKKLNQRVGSTAIYIIGLATSALMFFFVVKAVDLQYFKHEEFLKKSDRNQYVEIPVLPIRGSILDRNDIVLAKSEKNSSDDKDYKRIYTEKEGLAHVIGYVKYPQKDSSGNYWQTNFEGVSGIESYYDQLLTGRQGKRIFEKSVDQTLQNSFVTDYPIEGKDIKLAVDSELTEYAHKKLRNYVLEHQFKGGTIIIMEIETGEIVVMTNYPEYEISKMVPSEDVKVKEERSKYVREIMSDKQNPLLNRAISGTFAPGSVLKTIFALAGLQLGLIDPVTSIFSAGYIEIPSSIDPTKKNIFKDWKAHGWVNVRTALANSSDVFFYAIGGGYEGQKGMGIERIKEYSEAFGVNTPTGIDLGGEVVGNIPDPEWKKRIFKENWRLGDTYTSSIGQFGFLTTPIGVVRMMAAIATNGDLITPKMRKDSLPPQIKKVKVSVNDEWYKVVQDGMRMTITNGTAKKLNSDILTISGKSGTAEVGVKKDKIQSWIAGYFPAKQPKYAYVFLCELGIREVSPTPNPLAREVIEKMYSMPEYNKILRPINGLNDGSIPLEIDAEAVSTTTEDDLQSR